MFESTDKEALFAQAKTELSKNPQDLIALIDKCIIGICVTAGDGVFIHANEPYLQIYGYQMDELIGKHFTLMAPTQDRNEVWQAIYDAFIEDGTEMAGEWVVKNKEGKLLTIFTDAVRVGNEQDGYQKVTFVNDITDLRTLQRDYHEVRQRFLALVQQPFSLIALADVHSEQVILANKAFVDHVGLTTDNVETVRLGDLLNPTEGDWAQHLQSAQTQPEGHRLALSWKNSTAQVEGHLRHVGQNGFSEVLLTLKA